jgi:hypothetical protein
MLTVGIYTVDLPVAHESNTPVKPDLADQVASFVGPIPIRDAVMIQNGSVAIKPNPPSEPPPPPPPKPKQKVYAALVNVQFVPGTPIDPGTIQEGTRVGDGECVTFAKAYVGVAGTWGYGGKNLSANDPQPHIGDVVLFYGHVAVIIGMQADGGLILIESNYHLNHKVTMGRIVYIGDSSIRGYHKF